MSMRSSKLPKGRVDQNDLERIVGYSIGNAHDLNSKNAIGFKSGIRVRYTPGIHYVEENYVVLPETNNFSVDNQFTISPGNKRLHTNLYGSNNTSTSHLYATNKRVTEVGYNLQATRANMRPPDQSNYAIAEVIINKFKKIVAPVKNNQYDDTILVNITPESANCIEADGLVVYGAPGNGKTTCMDSYYLRSIDTDYIYDPNSKVIEEMASLCYTIFTNDYTLGTPNVPTIMFMPTNAIMMERILKKVNIDVSVVNEWVSDLNQFVLNLERNEKQIIDKNQCVVIVKVADDDIFIKNVMQNLCRR